MNHGPSYLRHKFSKMIGIRAIAVFALFSAVSGSKSSKPIQPADYRNLTGQGFSTNWFKSEEPLSKYNDKNIDDIYSMGFRNVRLRSRADLYDYPYNQAKFKRFLADLKHVVDKCLDRGVTPIISWIHHDAEAYATKEDHKAYLKWWTLVAEQFKNTDYRLGFNLFTELGVDECGKKCGESLRMRPDKYNKWTADVVAAIRDTGGKNKHRILILGSPGKTGKDLDEIDEDIYQNDPYMMAEWHMYASGPNKKKDGQKYWSGDGSGRGQTNVREAIKEATDFTKTHKLLTYLGAWMPLDNKRGKLKQHEVIHFARFFASELRKEKIPWSLNVLDQYYDTKKSEWKTGKQKFRKVKIDMEEVLKNIRKVM